MKNTKETIEVKNVRFSVSTCIVVEQYVVSGIKRLRKQFMLNARVTHRGFCLSVFLLCDVGTSLFQMLCNGGAFLFLSLCNVGAFLFLSLCYVTATLFLSLCNVGASLFLTLCNVGASLFLSLCIVGASLFQSLCNVGASLFQSCCCWMWWIPRRGRWTTTSPSARLTPRPFGQLPTIYITTPDIR